MIYFSSKLWTYNFILQWQMYLICFTRKSCHTLFTKHVLGIGNKRLIHKFYYSKRLWPGKKSWIQTLFHSRRCWSGKINLCNQPFSMQKGIVPGKSIFNTNILYIFQENLLYKPFIIQEGAVAGKAAFVTNILLFKKARCTCKIYLW